MARSLSPLLRTLALIAGMLGAAGVTPARALVNAPLATSNLARLELAAAAAADSLLDRIDGDTLCVAVVEHDARWLLESAIVERAAARGVTVRRCEASDAGRIEVAIITIGVVYRRIDDGLERVATLSLSSSAPSSLAESGTTRPLRALRAAAALADTLAAADTAGLGDAAYPYSIGTVADDSSGGFWRTIVEPAVVLAASAIVAILLFTVRSQ